MAAKKTKKPSEKAPRPHTGAASSPTKARAGDAPAAPLAPSDEKHLLSLPATYDKLPDQSIPRMLSMGREVLAGGRQAIDVLEEHTRVRRADIDRLDAALARLARCEALWAQSRDTRVDPKDVKAGEALKSDALAALDYWLEGNEDVEVRVSKIREGTGIADLADDLEKLADLLDAYRGDLKKADLQKGAPALMRSLAETLLASLAGRKSDVKGKALLSLRNRAFYGLMAEMDKVCSAGRYAFRKEPRKAKLFASVATRKRSQTKVRGKSKPEPPTPTPS